MSAKELKDKLKKLRMEHSGKAVGKMSPDEIEKEIAHHETACKARDLKEKRLAALAKARESKKEKEPEPKLEVKEVKKEKKEVKEPKKEKAEKKMKYTVMSDSEESSTDSDTETIRHRIQKKKRAKSESAE
jgi:hypothetical protein